MSTRRYCVTVLTASRIDWVFRQEYPTLPRDGTDCIPVLIEFCNRITRRYRKVVLTIQ